jgi:hypothetical protein
VEFAVSSVCRVVHSATDSLDNAKERVAAFDLLFEALGSLGELRVDERLLLFDEFDELVSLCLELLEFVQLLFK